MEKPILNHYNSTDKYFVTITKEEIKTLTIGQKQKIFVKMVSQLINYIYSKGYECSFGHALRCNDCKIGKKNSNHKIRLAIDLNLFKDGKYYPKTEDHKEFGQYWESMGGSWGGRFQDGGHYSIEHNGMK